MNKMLSFYKTLYFFIANLFHNFKCSTIIKVVEVDYSGYVYNLSIDKDETYIADGVVVHNCRSTTIPKLKPQFDLGASVHGERPSRGAKGFKQESAAVTYSGWLREQPIEFVNEALGPKRAALFKYHNIPIKEMIDSSGKRKTLDNFYDPTGKVYTLKELIDTNTISMIQ